MTTVKIDSKKTTTGSDDDEATATTSKKVTCEECDQWMWKGSKHCKVCWRHFRGDSCWYCNLEQALDWWKLKEQRLKKKAESQTSITGPLHQQSGNAYPTSSTDALRSILKKTDD